MSLSTVAVTGGNGKIGSEVLAHLNEAGYETVNLARGKRREEESDTYITTDLLDAGNTYGALAKSNTDAVIHMGTIPGPYNHPAYRTYESNVMSAMHILEASESLGLDAVCLASSINAIGSEHQHRPADIRYLPVDEAHPRTPSDEYGLAKHAMEVTADGFGRRRESELTISSIRYPWVPTEDEIGKHFVPADRSLSALEAAHPATTRDVLFSYLHVDDAATVARKAIEADFDGHEIFWAVAEDTTAGPPTRKVITEFFPKADLRMDPKGHEALIDISKAERYLDWIPQHSWRDLEGTTDHA